MTHEQRAIKLIALGKLELIRNANLFRESHECGYDIIRHEHIPMVIPEEFRDYFYEVSRGSTCVEEGRYFHDVKKFIDLL